MVMGAATVVDEDVTTGEPAAESTEPQAEVAEQEAEPTLAELKAQLATEKAERLATENRLKSTQGVLKVKLDTEGFQQATRRGLANLEARLTALAKGQASGDTETAQRELAAVEAQLQQERTQEDFGTQFAKIQRRVVRDMDSAGLNAASPELVEANRVWDEADRAMKAGHSNVALKLFDDAAELTAEVRYNLQLAAWEKEQVETRKKSGSLSTPNIRASGNRNTAAVDAQLEKDVAAGRVAMTPEIQKRLDKYWNT